MKCNVVNDTLQSALVPGSGRRGEDGLNGYFVKLHHCCLWVLDPAATLNIEFGKTARVSIAQKST